MGPPGDDCVTGTDKIRMAYIDSEMAKRYHRNPQFDTQETSRLTVPEPPGAHMTSSQAKREPASLGKLHEIDLGQETRLQNIERTKAATRRLVGDEEDMNSEEASGAPKHGGPDDKRWRHRKRRTSADLERDRLVEEVLRESKCTSPWNWNLPVLGLCLVLILNISGRLR